MDAQKLQTFDLPGVVDVDAMDELREWLGSALEIGDIKLSASKVTRLVTNALLMLMSAKQTAEKNGFSFCISEASPAFLEAVNRLGMGEIISPIVEGN